MKNLFLGLALSIMSLGVFAASQFEDSARLNDCGGTVELRSYKENGRNKYALKFVGVKKCSNVRLATGENYKLTNKDGEFETKSFTLSNKAVDQAYYRLGVEIESNSGKTYDSVSVKLR